MLRPNQRLTARQRPAHAGTSVHVPAHGDQRCPSLIAAWPHPTLASRRSGPPARTRSPDQELPLAGPAQRAHTTTPELGCGQARTRARIGDPAPAEAGSPPVSTSRSVAGPVWRLTSVSAVRCGCLAFGACLPWSADLGVRRGRSLHEIPRFSSGDALRVRVGSAAGNWSQTGRASSQTRWDSRPETTRPETTRPGQGSPGMLKAPRSRAAAAGPPASRPAFPPFLPDRPAPSRPPCPGRPPCRGRVARRGQTEISVAATVPTPGARLRSRARRSRP